MNGELGRGCGGGLDAWAERARNTHRQLDTKAEGRTTLSPESMSVAEKDVCGLGGVVSILCRSPSL